ncbi:MAG: hypothetical protein LBQ47_07530 [Endomicrobium sp.]|jgi:hypothetical protein|nr:hypothetical protein [Endomicrobium sp.]
MNTKITAIIISVFLFAFPLAQLRFANAYLYLEKNNNAEISCSVAKAANFLDISNKTFKKYYADAKDFFFNGLSGAREVPVYNCKTYKITINAVLAYAANNKKNIFYVHNVSNYTRFVYNGMQGSPPGLVEITKMYLLFLEALHKGSAPALFFIDDNILSLNSVCFLGKPNFFI